MSDKLILSYYDRGVLETWRRGPIKVLRDVNPKEYKEPTGKVIVLACSDGHQMPDVCMHQVKMTADGHVPMVHILALNGGSLLLAPGSPLLDQGDTDDLVVLKHIRGAHSIKGTPTFIPLPHAPCGAALGAGLSIVEVVEHLFKAKQRVKEAFPELQIIPKLHVDWAKDADEVIKRTYFVDRNSFEQWRAKAA